LREVARDAERPETAISGLILGLGGIVLLQVAAYPPGFIAFWFLFRRKVRPVFRVRRQVT
jgi:hypothetical protein